MKTKRVLVCGLMAVILSLAFVACDSGGGGTGGTGGGEGTGDGGEEATYGVTWFTGWNDDEPTLTITWGNIDHSEQDAIEKAMKTSDIIMTPNDVITLDTITTNAGVKIACTVLKSGTVKITLKPIAGYTFTKASWGKDTIEVE